MLHQKNKMDPTPEERQRARAALGNTNVQDASQLGELIGHLVLKMSEHSNSATAYINTLAEDINSLSHKLNKFASDADTQFQDLHQRIPMAAAAGGNPPPAAAATPPIQGMIRPATAGTRISPFTLTPMRRRTRAGSAGFTCLRMQPK